MELGLLVFAVVVFSRLYDNLYEFVPMIHAKNPILAYPQKMRMVFVILYSVNVSCLTTCFSLFYEYRIFFYDIL